MMPLLAMVLVVTVLQLVTRTVTDIIHSANGGLSRSRDSTPSSAILCNNQVNGRNNDRLGSEISYRSPTSIPVAAAGRNLGHSESSPLLTRDDKRSRPSWNNSEVAIDKGETGASNSDSQPPPSIKTGTIETLGASKEQSVQAVHSLSSQSFMRAGSHRLDKSHEMRSCLMLTNTECTHSSSSTSATSRLMDLEMMAMSSSVETASSLLATTSVNESLSHRQELSLSSRLREMAKSFLEAEELALARTAEQRNALLDELIGELNRLRLTGDQASIEGEPPNLSSSPDSTVDGGEGGDDELTALPVPRKYSRSYDLQYPKETGSSSYVPSETTSPQARLNLIRQFKSLDRDVMQPSHMGMVATGRALRQSLAMLLERKRRGELGDTSEIVVEENGDVKSSPEGANEDEEEEEVYFL